MNSGGVLPGHRRLLERTLNVNHSHDTAPFAEDMPATLSDIGDVEAQLENVEARLRAFEHRLDFVERRLRAMDRALCRLWGNTYGPPVLPETD